MSPDRHPTFPQSFDLFLTRRCNGHCCHCSMWKNKTGDLSWEHASSFVRQIAGWTDEQAGVNIVGGEPTIHDDLLRLLQLCTDQGVLGVVTTNGYRLSSPSYARDFVNTGARRVVISLDGFEESNDHLRGEGAFNRAVRAIRNLRELDDELEIAVQCVVCSKNVAELPEYAWWLQESERVHSVTFQSLCHDFNVGLGDDWQKQNPLWPTDHDEVCATLDGLIMRQPHSNIVNSIEQFRFWKRYFKDPTALERTAFACDLGDFFVQCNNDGSIRLCPFKQAIGDLDSDPLDELFHSGRASKMRREIAGCTDLCNFIINCRFDLLRTPQER